MSKAQREIQVEIGGQTYVGRYDVSDFAKSVHTITVWYHGKKATDTIPPEVNHELYNDFLAEKLLKRLVCEEIGVEPDGE